MRSGVGESNLKETAEVPFFAFFAILDAIVHRKLCKEHEDLSAGGKKTKS